MPRNLHRHTNLPERLSVRRKAEYAMKQMNAADTCDDRVSENIFDEEDERAEVDLIVRQLFQSTH
jgi:hypothetical protein